MSVQSMEQLDWDFVGRILGDIQHYLGDKSVNYKPSKIAGILIEEALGSLHSFITAESRIERRHIARYIADIAERAKSMKEYEG